MKKCLTFTALVFIGLGLAGCSEAQSAKPDCSRSLSSLKHEVQQMATKGQYDAAQKKSAAYRACFENDADYWVMRISALKSSNSTEKASHADTLKGVRFMNHAIEAAPDREYFKVIKSGMLLTAKKYKAGVSLYEQQLNKAIQRGRDSDPATPSDTTLIETAPYYINALKRQEKINRSQAHLRPFLSHVCLNMPKLKKHYASRLIVIHQVFSGKEPSVPRDPKKKSQALESACASFKP